MLKEIRNLPDNWKKVLISDVLFFQEGPGVRKWQFTQEGVKLLNGGNINNNTINLNSTKIHISEEEANGKYSHFMIDPGDLVIACSGVVVDKFKYKIAFIKEKHTPLCLNTSTMRFKSLGEIDLDFYSYFLQTNLFSKQLQRLITGSAQLNFGPSHIKKMKVLLPPLDEQKKIAAIIDAADEHRQKTKALIEKYDQLTQSLFLDMFGDSSNIERTDLANIVSEKRHFVDGPFGSNLKVSDQTESGVRLVQVNNIGVGEFRDKTSRFTSVEKYEALIKHEVIPGDLVVAKMGEPLGRCCLLPNHIPKALVVADCMRIRVSSPDYISKYVMFFLNSSDAKQQIKNLSRGSTRVRINLSMLRKLKIPKPTLSSQNQFAERVEQIEKQKQQAEASLVKAEELFSNLLQRAFKGELTS